MLRGWLRQHHSICAGTLLTRASGRARLKASSQVSTTGQRAHRAEAVHASRERSCHIQATAYCRNPAGTLLLATPEAPIVSGDGRVTQLVVLVLRHDPLGGTVGLMLNRPCFASVGDLLGWG